MRIIKKFFKTILALIMIPTFIIIAVILWSYITGNSLTLPFTVKEASADNFLLKADILTADVYDSNSQTPIGKRGYIQVSRAELADMTLAQYQEFYEQKLLSSDYLWFSVICPDGSGLFIPNCADGSACFCSLDDLGRQQQIYGYLIVSGGTCVYEEAKNS